MNFPEQNFECSGCGRCCRGWKVEVDPKTYRTVQGSDLEKSIRAHTGAPGMMLLASGNLSTARRPNGDCAYLSPGDRCRIHEEMGGPAKPLGCQQFPFLLIRCPDGVTVGASFFAPPSKTIRGRRWPATKVS